MPLIKIGYLLIRTVSKPVANVLKHQTKSHPAFRAACVRLAQAYHRTEIRLSRRIVANGNGDATSGQTEQLIRPLDEQRAINVGANFMGEALVFLVAGVILVIDGAISARKEQARRQAMEDRFTELFSEVESLKRRLTASVVSTTNAASTQNRP